MTGGSARSVIGGMVKLRCQHLKSLSRSVTPPASRSSHAKSSCLPGPASPKSPRWRTSAFFHKELRIGIILCSIYHLRDGRLNCDSQFFRRTWSQNSRPPKRNEAVCLPIHRLTFQCFCHFNFLLCSILCLFEFSGHLTEVNANIFCDGCALADRNGNLHSIRFDIRPVLRTFIANAPEIWILRILDNRADNGVHVEITVDMMCIELGIFLKQDATLPDDQRRRHGNRTLTVPAGLRYAIVMFLCIKEYLRAALRAKNNAGEQIGKCLKPLFFGHAFIWRGQTNCKGLYKRSRMTCGYSSQ